MLLRVARDGLDLARWRLALMELAFWLAVRCWSMQFHDFAHRRSHLADARVQQALLRSARLI